MSSEDSRSSDSRRWDEFQREIARRSLAEPDPGWYAGYRISDLGQASGQVKPAGNWKLAIDATVPADADQGMLSAAIAFYTGSEALFVQVKDAAGEQRLRVMAAGYYADIGS